MSTKVTRGNERIVAPQHEQPIRFTRQRMTEINQESMHSATVPTQHNLSPTTNYDLTHSLIVPTQPSSSAATNHESTQSIDTATQPTSPIHEEGDNHNGDEGK
jgi:hypothetical protein